MVNRAYTFDEEEPSFHRHTARGHSYPLSHDRELPSAPGHNVYPSRGQHLSSLDTRNGDHSQENDSSSRPRSRIPVACGRCRKRKIRCSGDNGGPCSNCKSAGNEQCQFLRVSSHETQLKNEAGYEYDSSAGAAARLSFRTASYGPQYGPNLGLDGYQYRSNSSASLYPYAPKTYYSAQSPYGEFADENVDYGLQVSITTSPQFQQTILAPDLGLAPTYTTSNIGRGWTPAPQFPKALFLEPHDSAYSHGQLPYHGSMYGLRMAVPESKGVSLNGSSSSLPAPITGSDRVLPLPAANRAVEVGSFLRPTENLLPATQPGYQSYNNGNSGNNGLMSTGMLGCIKNQHGNSVSENGSMSSGYLPMPNGNPESLSSQMSYCSQPISLSPQHTESYTPPSPDHMYRSGESDSMYGHSSEGSEQGRLANGHVYVRSSAPAAPTAYQPPPPPVEEQYSRRADVSITNTS